MKKLPLILVLLCLGCSQPQPVVHIELTNSQRSLKITGIDSLILNDIARDSSADWQSLFPVYRMPADTDMKDYQNAQPGIYKVQSGAVLFTPDTPFVKPRTYFLRYYEHATGKDAWTYISGEGNKGAAHYIDLIFRPNSY